MKMKARCQWALKRSSRSRVPMWAAPTLGPGPGRGRAYHPEGPGGVVALQRHLQPVVLGPILIHFGAGLVHLLPGRRGNRFLRVVPRGVVFIVFLILVVPLLGLLLLCRYGHGHRREPRRSPGFPPHRLAAGRGNLAAAGLPQRQAPRAQSHCAPRASSPSNAAHPARGQGCPEVRGRTPGQRPVGTVGDDGERLWGRPPPRNPEQLPHRMIGTAGAGSPETRPRHVSPRSPRSLLPMSATATTSQYRRGTPATALCGTSGSHRKFFRPPHRKSRLWAPGRGVGV